MQIKIKPEFVRADSLCYYVPFTLLYSCGGNGAETTHKCHAGDFSRVGESPVGEFVSFNSLCVAPDEGGLSGQGGEWPCYSGYSQSFGEQSHQIQVRAATRLH
ncbi:hypothetical protein KIL84_007036 [Mauremys mutica]|uniref:Uncharacterized protein n=1 Tax=Mauremys mutica TaxID=74926 RepID=A0A9D4AUP6_9SAUR|nr:hypothetical protein KIL84_007036 [Mauremys mutica]